MISEDTSSFHVTLFSGCSPDLYPENTLSKFTVKLPVTLNFSKHQWEVCIDKISFTSIKNDGSYGRYNYMCIYSDIIKPVIVGNQLSRAILVKPIIYEDSGRTRTIINILNPSYVQLDQKYISEIKILLNDERGEQINFIDDTFQTMIRLNFRKMC